MKQKTNNPVLSSDEIKSKSDKKFGELIAKKIESHIKSAYFISRNERFRLNRDMAAGRMDISKFKKQMDMDGGDNYGNLSWKSIMIVNTIIARLVGRWMTKKEKIIATAIDPISVKQKKEERDQAEFVLDHKEMLGQLQAASGVPAVSADQFIPEDHDELDMWATDVQRSPEEILFEKGTNNVFALNGWKDTLKRKSLWDSACVGLIGTRTYADKDGVVHVDYLTPENIVYSDSEYPDFRDTSLRGVVDKMTICQIRDEYPDLDEEDLYAISQTAKEYNNQDKVPFNTTWKSAYRRPYDDWNVDVVRFEYKTYGSDNKLFKVGSDGKLYIDHLKKKPNELYGKNQFEKAKWDIYYGVWATEAQVLLEWDLEKNMIRPQDPKEIGDAEFSISLYMYNPDEMRNLAVPEKIEEPVEMMILTRLKIQQLVAKMRPSGIRVDVDGLENLDLAGTGKMFSPMEIQKVYDQTGNLYYRSKGADGLPINSQPITELANAGSVGQLQELVELYNYHLQVLRDEVGINEFAEGQTVKPRTGQGVVEGQQEISWNATDYMHDAYLSLMEETGQKVACLLHDSVLYGGKAYREYLKEEQVKGRVFSTKIEMLPQEDEVTYIQNMVTTAINSNPILVQYVDPFKINRMARENVKLAEKYFRMAQKRAIQGEEKKAQQNSEMNGQLQMQSAQAKAQGDAQVKQLDGQLKMAEIDAQSKASKEAILLTGLFSIYSKGLPVPPEFQALTQEIIQNIAMPMLLENMQNKVALGAGMQQIQQAAQQQQDQAQQGVEEPQPTDGMGGQPPQQQAA